MVLRHPPTKTRGRLRVLTSEERKARKRAYQKAYIAHWYKEHRKDPVFRARENAGIAQRKRVRLLTDPAYRKQTNSYQATVHKLRYHTDPEYRARCLAQGAAYRRRRAEQASLAKDPTPSV